MKKLSVKSLDELHQILIKINTEEYDLINYVWVEYGFYPIIFNELFLPFFNEAKGKKIGICFPGHEIFYEKHVEILITLDGFIDTTKAYKDNVETDLLINNFKTYTDRGVAFWFTLRNFDENAYKNTINQFTFRNMIFPIGDTKPWDSNIFSLPVGFHYGSGVDGDWKFQANAWNTTGVVGWNLDICDPKFQTINTGFIPKYNAFFVKNSWKNRKYSSSNIDDILVGTNGIDGEKTWSYVEYDFYLDIINYHIKNKMKLVIINDLVKFTEVKSEYIQYLNMYSFFDVKLFVNVVNNAENFISICTSPMDIATYYCNTNLVYLNVHMSSRTHSELRSIVDFAERAQKIKQKKCMFYSINSDEKSRLFNFIDYKN